MTLLDFSSMTPIRIQVLYCESITNMRTSPISEVVCVAPLTAPGWRLCTGSALAPASSEECADVRWAASTASTMPRFLETASTNWAVVEMSVDPMGLFTTSSRPSTMARSTRPERRSAWAASSSATDTK